VHSETLQIRTADHLNGVAALLRKGSMDAMRVSVGRRGGEKIKGVIERNCEDIVVIGDDGRIHPRGELDSLFLQGAVA